MSSSGRSLGQSSNVSGSTGSPTTGSASFADLAEMSITLTTRGGAVLLDFLGVFSHSGTGRIDLAFNTDGGGEFGTISATSPGAGVLMAIPLMSIANPAAGSHTFKVRWATSAATATASGTVRSMRAVELPL